MKKLLCLFLALCGIYILLSVCMNHWNDGYTIQYIVNTENKKFEIEEQYQKKTKTTSANYTIKIQIDDIVFPIQMLTNEKSKKIITDVYYYEDDNYQCIYPVSKVDMNIDVLCQKEQVIYSYQSLTETNLELDQFVDSVKDVGYDVEQFSDRKSIIKVIDGISIYDNLIEDHTIGFENYKGLYILNKDDLLQEKKIFQNDIYQKSVHLFYDKYYIVADYDEKYEFHEFYVVNMDTLKQTKIVSNTPISLDSYIQGVVEDSIYVLDRTNKKQYRIYLTDKVVAKVGDTEKGVQYYSYGKWETRTMYEILKQDTLFIDSEVPNEIDISSYSGFRVVDRYCYLYEKTDAGYRIYRVLLDTLDVRFYITTISDFKNIQYINDYIYWKEKDSIYYYHDSTGVRQILQNPEFEFNSHLIFGID